jgi:hypothetical protein
MNLMVVRIKPASNAVLSNIVMHSMHMLPPPFYCNEVTPVLKFNFDRNGVTP